MSKIYSNEPIGSGLRRMMITGIPAAAARPGQFAMITIPGQYLPRPFSIEFATDRSWSIAYKIAGPGTAAMARMGRGDDIDIDGPIGNGWPLPAKNARILLVGGGVGWAPLCSLLKATRRSEDKTDIVVAGRDAESLGWIVGMPSAYEYRAATDDGSLGFHGNAAGLVKQVLAGGEKYGAAYVCGPDAMMRSVSELTRAADIRTWVSLEKRMACGAGACKGCQVDGTAGKDGLPLHVCKDGPVFDARVVYGKIR